MNIRQANLLSLKDIVERNLQAEFDHEDIHGSRWYISPLRAEKTASFHITEVRDYQTGEKRWVWKDFGDIGGDVIDLIMKHRNLRRVEDALRTLEGWGYGGYRAKTPPKPAPLLDLIAWQERQQNGKEAAATSEGKSESSTFEDARMEDLSNKALKGYLYGRGIDFWVAKPYLKEIHYTNNGKPYFALAFRNDAGDYELRNPYYQGVYGKKAITTLHSEKMQEGGTVIIFEGFMDFLSSLIWYGMKPCSTVIVLNSVEMKHEAVKAIRELKAGSVESYPDNDEAGRKLMDYLRENLPGVYIEDKSSLYADLDYKDLNELLQAEKAKEKKQAMGR